MGMDMPDAWAPHGMCYLWSPVMIQWQVYSDLAIALSYFAIPLLMWLATRARPELQRQPLLWWFAAFVFLCGTTHLMAIVTIWQPIYRVDASIKTVTGLVSMVAASLLWKQVFGWLRAVDRALLDRDTEAVYRLVQTWRRGV